MIHYYKFSIGEANMHQDSSVDVIKLEEKTEDEIMYEWPDNQFHSEVIIKTEEIPIDEVSGEWALLNYLMST